MHYMTKFAMGMQAQKAVEIHLLNKGYDILERNYRTKTGEIDLIARDKNYVVFIEVKFRKNINYGLPREAVSYKKQQRIINTAVDYIEKMQLTCQDLRFDVAEVLIDDRMMKIEHIENAFDGA